MLSKYPHSVWFLLILCINYIGCDQLVGNVGDVDENDRDSVRELLVDSLNQLKGEENGIELNLIRISSIKSQVVAGKKYTIQGEFATSDNSIKKNCEVSLWHKAWSGFRETSFDCDDETKYKVTKQSRKKRSAIGGPVDVEPDTLDELRKNITDSFGQLGASDASKQLKLKEVYGAQRKVVAGILYTVRAKVETNEGEKNCSIEVWEKPWIHFRRVTVNCGNGKTFEVVYDGTTPKKALMADSEIESKDEEKEKEEEEEENDDDESEIDDWDSLDIEQVNSATLFGQYKRHFGRLYKDAAEESMRYRIFQQNLYLIKQLKKFELGTAKYGLTDFADLTEEEYKMRTGLRPELRSTDNDIPNPMADIPNIVLPEAYDWRDHGAITPVKNQGNCGSCWAFSVTGNIEGLNAIQTGKLVSLSEQELVDCDDVDSGCNGGLPDNAVKYIEKRGGLETEGDYPYTAHKQKCSFNMSLARVQVSGVVDFKEKDEDGMAKWLIKNGPISIGINANAMQFYRGGISHPWKALCRSSGLDHGVLIVGFGVSHYPVLNKTIPFWTIKNSWGPRWGERGYYRIYRGDNSCGVSSMADSAVLSKKIDYNFV